VHSVRLSCRDDRGSYLGTAAEWVEAERALRAAADEVLTPASPPLVDAAGEAAFYGPKLDLQVRDRAGHEETIATVHLDFNQPERFDLSYAAADGGRRRPVMIHRGTVGSMERAVAALLERYRGRLPLWLFPVQVRVLPVTAAQDDDANRFLDDLRAAGIRAELDTGGHSPPASAVVAGAATRSSPSSARPRPPAAPCRSPTRQPEATAGWPEAT
jgi:threonyl-tRNA synthetase